jgi:orotate phosphoribosyltransferase
MTTGSTAAACARALKQAGVARVVLLTVARVDRRLEAGKARPFSGEGEEVS